MVDGSFSSAKGSPNGSLGSMRPACAASSSRERYCACALLLAYGSKLLVPVLARAAERDGLRLCAARYSSSLES